MTTLEQGTRRAEAQAKQALRELSKHQAPPPALDLMPILSLLPQKDWTSAPNPHGYIVFGLSPKANNNPKTLTVHHQTPDFLCNVALPRPPFLQYCRQNRREASGVTPL